MVTDRSRLAAVEWASRPLRQDGSLNRPCHPRRPYPARLPRGTSVRTAAGSRCYFGPAMIPLPQRSAEIKVECLGGGWPWVSCKLSPGFSPPGWLLTDDFHTPLILSCAWRSLDSWKQLNAYGLKPGGTTIKRQCLVEALQFWRPRCLSLQFSFMGRERKWLIVSRFFDVPR